MESYDVNRQKPEHEPYECPGCGRQDETQNQEDDVFQTTSFCTACRRWF